MSARNNKHTGRDLPSATRPVYSHKGVHMTSWIHRLCLQARAALLLTGLSLSLTSVFAGPLEDALDRRLTSTNEIASLLAGVRDAATAQAVLPQLDAAIARNREHGQQLNTEMQKPGAITPASQQTLGPRLTQLQTLNGRIAAEQERFQRVPGLSAVMGNRIQLALQ